MESSRKWTAGLLFLALCAIPAAPVWSVTAAPDEFSVMVANTFRTCGITTAHELYCWGSDEQYGTHRLPELVAAAASIQGKVQQVTVGEVHTCALTLEHEVYCWGVNNWGHLGIGTVSALEPVAVRLQAFAPGSIRSIEAEGVHTCALTYGNDLYCWGRNWSGEVGNGTYVTQSSPQLITSGSPLAAGSVKSVSLGAHNTCALTIGGDVYCWGGTPNIGNGTTSDATVPTAVSSSTGLLSGETVAISVGAGACAINSSGQLYCWGQNYGGQVGDNTLTTRTTPTLVHAGQGLVQGDVIAVDMNSGRTCAIDTSHALYCWGNNSGGKKLGIAPGTNSKVPGKVLAGQGLTTVRSVQSGYVHSCARSDVEYFCWGDNGYGQLGTGDTTDRGEPTRPTAVLPPVTQVLQLASISAGDHHSCGVDVDGDAYCWGLGADGRLGNDVILSRSSPSRVSLAPGLTPGIVSQTSAGGTHSCLRTTGGDVFCWGGNWAGQVGIGTAETQFLPAKVVGPSGFGAAADVDAGWAHTCAVNTAGAIYCWGNGAEGQLGDGTGTSSNTPIAVAAGGGYSGSNAIGIDAGDSHTCAALSSGQAVCWGANTSGQLGNGTTTSSLTPVAVSTVSTVADISAGGNHSCALRANQEIWCWGANAAGQLGQGNTSASATPLEVTTIGESSMVSAGRFFTCATQTSGESFCWGRNDVAQSGRLGGSNILNPSQVRPGAGLGDNGVRVTAGGRHACAINTNGEGWCWGQNSFGQLGNGATNTSANEPVFIHSTKRRAGI